MHKLNIKKKNKQLVANKNNIKLKQGGRDGADL